MMFKNTFRLLFANFSIFWKQFLYKVIVLALSFCLLLPVLGQIKNLTGFSLLIENIKELLLNMPVSSMKEYMLLCWQVVENIKFCILSLLNLNVFTLVYVCIVLFFICPFLFNLSDVAVGETLYASMSSCSKISYTGAFVSKIGKGILYSFLKTIISIPFTALILAGFYFFVSHAVVSDFWLIFAPILIIAFFILVKGFEICITSGVMPALIVFNCNLAKAYSKGYHALKRRFLRSFSTIAMLLLISTCLFVIFGVLSLVILFPLSYMIFLIFRMVMFFESQGMRYYVDVNTVLKPKQLEETDKLKKAIDII